MNGIEYLRDLRAALDGYRYSEIRNLTDSVDLRSLDAEQAASALTLLRRKRRFDDLEHAASLFSMSGIESPTIQKLYVQALIDQNRVDQALLILVRFEPATRDDPKEGPEIRGLIGRAYKQLYINSGVAENLRKAIDAYLMDWRARRGDYRWQGINLVALLDRAGRDGVHLPVNLDATELATEIRDDILTKGSSGRWDCATALEASIALNEEAAAMTWVRQYLLDLNVDAFEIGSTLRQLREVWQLDQSPFGREVIALLEFALLQKSGWPFEPRSSQDSLQKRGFQAVWGNEGVVNIRWFDTLLKACRGIARVVNSRTGVVGGTGFLVRGDLLCARWGEGPVLVTNTHVVSEKPEASTTIPSQESEAEFTRCTGSPVCPIGEQLFTSPVNDLDVSVFRLKTACGDALCIELGDAPDLKPELPETQRVYVIGHAGGREIAVSMYDNSLAEYDGHFVRYRSPTENGNSGSPLFDVSLKAFGVHHRALFERKLNEGVLLGSARGVM